MDVSKYFVYCFVQRQWQSGDAQFHSLLHLEPLALNYSTRKQSTRKILSASPALALSNRNHNENMDFAIVYKS